MRIVIDIPEEQIKKSLKESKYIHEDEGEKGFVDIMMLYTNGQLDFVDVTRKTDFYSCKYKILPKGHGRLIDGEEIASRIDALKSNWNRCKNEYESGRYESYDYAVDEIVDASTIIEADTESEE